MSTGEIKMIANEINRNGKMFAMADKTFPQWLQDEMDKRGWTQADLHRASGLRRGTISGVLNELRNPGFEFCEAIARALGLPADVVFRQAGLLPPAPKADPVTELGIHLLQQLPAEDRERFVEQMQALLAWQEAQRRRPRET
jgi:transcriptional regulator with XRE-family HTH domain